jgi:hypothetical protein
LEPTGRLYQIRKVFDAEGNRVGSGNLKSAFATAWQDIK